MTNHSKINDYVRTNPKSLTSKFGYRDVHAIADEILTSSGSGKEYAVLKFLQNYCIPIDKVGRVISEFRSGDPRYYSDVKRVKKNWRFKITKEEAAEETRAKPGKAKSDRKMDIPSCKKVDDALVNSIAEFIEKTCSDNDLNRWLKENYSWPDSEKKRVNLYKNFNTVFEPTSSNMRLGTEDLDNYEKTSRIKNYISNSLGNSNDPDLENKLVKFFIRDWGGVKSGDQTIQGIIRTRSNMSGPTDSTFSFKDANGDSKQFPRYSIKANSDLKSGGVSSWSKYMAIAYPEWAHIYDARVAYALNAIIYLYGLNHSCLWPIPSGRNSRLNLLDIETLILASQSEERQLTNDMSQGFAKSLSVSKFKKDYSIGDGEVYLLYLEVLKKVREKLNSRRSDICKNESEIEAFLFTTANREIFSAVFDKSLRKE